ncbi:MAG TPA: PEP-CTERM sorting domain-containing protein [Verrucomicrobiae bacterium]|nr:PEP-CTERM sorting domain-containing protein [Verrucomicrobiae bacterium]
MKNQSSFFTSFRQAALGASLAILGLTLLPGSGTAQTVTLNNGGSVASVNLGSSAGMDYWSVEGAGGQNQLPQQWFWYSVNGGAAQSIDQIGGLTYSTSPDDSSLTATYKNSTLSVGIVYTLQGSGVGSDAADMLESINIINNSATGFNINFYQYSNFNLLQNNQNTISVIGSPGSYSSIIQTTMVGGNGIEETIDNPLANYAEAGGASSVLGDVTAGNTLNGTLTAGPGNVAWAFEWSDSVGAGSNLDIYKDKSLSISPVPEPTTTGLVALGLGAFGFVRRIVKRKI